MSHRMIAQEPARVDAERGLPMAAPDPERSLANYRQLASTYDASCHRIEGIRHRAVESLSIQPGETVFDVACGTGTTLCKMAALVGASGHAVGIEMSSEMAACAQRKVEVAGLHANTCVSISSAESFRTVRLADAMLFCYTHDVLQSPAAIANLLAHARPGCRVAIVGIRFQPWQWGWPVNLVTAFRTRRFLRTYAHLEDPWHLLAPYLHPFQIKEHIHWGSSYRAWGVLNAERPACA
jgi:SAM-dependent methyltransferase